MTPAFAKALRRCGLAIAFALAATSWGCGGPSHAKPVDAELARSTLVDALESWKAGKQPADLRSNSPEVVVQDPDWLAGRRLANFELLDDGKALDANLSCRVKLTFADTQTAPGEKTVTYIIGTDPVLTIFRDVFQ